jgi:VWFA-related protein
MPKRQAAHYGHLSATLSFALSLLWFGLLAASAQEPVASTETTKTIAIYVSVLDRHFQPVLDLTTNDFHLLVDGKETKLASLVAGDSRPRTIGLLIDVSASRRNELPGVEAGPAYQLFQSLLRPGDAAFVAVFNEHVVPLSPLTGDLSALREALEQATHTTPGGATALYDAIAWACQTPFSMRPGNGALVVISDAGDNSSHISRGQAIETALRNNVTIWNIELAIGPTDKRARLASSISAESTSKETGGHAIELTDKAETKQVFEELSNALQSTYRLEFAPPPSGISEKLHKVKVKVAREHVKVFAPAGYYHTKPDRK